MNQFTVADKLQDTSNAMDDKSATLVSDCMAGDRKAQNELYRLLKPILTKVCRQYCKTQEDAEDVLSETFVRIFMNLEKYRGHNMAELTAWCKTIATRRAIDKFNADRASKRCGFNIGYNDIHGYLPSVPNTASPDKELILGLMVDMPKKPRLIFMLREIEGYTYDELTVILGMKMNALKTNYHRARKWLMERLDADYKIAGAER